MFNRLPKQTEIGKVTFQSVRNNNMEEQALNQSPGHSLTFCSCKTSPLVRPFTSFLACGVCPGRAAPVPAGQLRNKAKRQSPNIHHSPSQHNTCTLSGASANAGPHYQKLYARVTHIWGNRKGQPDPSAMKGPRLERTASLITVPPASGKFFYV